MSQYFEKIKQKLKHLYIAGRYPERDWARLLVAFCVLAIFIGAWSASFYFQVNTDVVSDSSISQAGNALSQRKEKELQELLAKYDEKAARYQELQNRLPVIVAPVATTTATTTTEDVSTTAPTSTGSSQ